MNSVFIAPILRDHCFNRIPVLYQGARVLLVVRTFALHETATLLSQLRQCRKLDFKRRVEIHPHNSKPLWVRLDMLQFMTDRQTLEDLTRSLVGCISQADKQEQARHRHTGNLSAPLTDLVARKGYALTLPRPERPSGQYPIYRPQEAPPDAPTLLKAAS